ncbi:undecaprenyl diphosphate synthase [Synechococcus sp. PCC 7335]|uniref:isoprenyl transferase n=1 Tax=Synechococcus sp. (strain ATCC 29403 / PCC 7335) TaxID=91464 RepID=UPI00017ED8C8|nr:isoprenyl transferase [Synechococcus sp. PCC 7335]EDX84143.1 undecaprenyl diphosphate synthase [Synechococcus sp. PCC 7335]
MHAYSVLPDDINPLCVPKHVAVIMDGNGRWANQRCLPRVAGHRQGARVLKDLLRCCKDWGIEALTAYAFSTENWKRPTTEVDFLMVLFEKMLKKELMAMHQEGVRVRFIGDLSALPPILQKEMNLAVEETANNTAIDFNVAVNYGSRSEITMACQQIAQKVEQGAVTACEVTEDMIAEHLYTQGSDPDLLIRTSGEQRLSNFLLWQLAYTEMVFTDAFWPDFDRAQFHRALLIYQRRDRRFGNASDAVLLQKAKEKAALTA